MPEETPRASVTFTVIVFVVAAVVGILVAYLGMTGRIGGPIP
jgi:hypothetical protein